MKNITLNNGVEMPIMGYGVYQIPDHEECRRCVLDALDVGYRSIDTAASYQNEEAVGEAIQESVVDREDIFVTSKLWISGAGYENTKKAVDVSLNKLQTDYMDLYLIHQPFGDVHGSWRAMEELYQEGLIKAIGVANFHPDRVMDLIVNNEVVPAVNQIETHPFYQRREDQQFLEENEVQHESWAPFAEGKNDTFNNELLVSIGEKYDKSAAQVVLRWLIQRGVVVIPKTVHKARMKENFNVFDFELSVGDMESIQRLDTGESQFFNHRDPEMIKWFAERLEED
ncbi:MAG TPA: aldo/keto reductase [Fodinibius sp.]|nr:aldo/keto reductase [Fodinibius sp.]